MSHTCPACGSGRFHSTAISTDLQTFFDIDNIIVEICSDCEAVWFDAGEMAQFFGEKTDLPDIEDSLASAVMSLKSCPKCSDRMLYTIPHSKEDEAMVNYCKTCKGILYTGHPLTRPEHIVYFEDRLLWPLQLIQDLIALLYQAANALEGHSDPPEIKLPPEYKLSKEEWEKLNKSTTSSQDQKPQQNKKPTDGFKVLSKKPSMKKTKL